jgi:hypothetical protein
MSERLIEDWQEILRKLGPEAAAKRVLSDLTHYRHGGSFEHQDEKQLATVLQAWARLAIDERSKENE